MAARIAARRVAIDFRTQDALDTYLKEHPKADKSNHKVVKVEVVDHRKDPIEVVDHRKDPKKPQVPDPGISDGHPDVPLSGKHKKKLQELVSNIPTGLDPDSKTGQVLSKAQKGEAPTEKEMAAAAKEIKDAKEKDASPDTLKRLRESEKRLRDIADFLEALAGEGGRYKDDEPRYKDFDGDYISDEAQNLIGTHKLQRKSVSTLQDFVRKRDALAKKEKAIELDFPKAKKKYEEDKAGWDKAVKSYEKDHPPKSKPSKKGEGTEEYDKALKEYEKDEAEKADALPDEPRPPRAPRKPKSTTEVMKDFIDAVDDPEEKARIREMKPEEFENLMGALRGTGKSTKLAVQVIRLAYTSNHTLRHHLLRVLHEH